MYVLLWFLMAISLTVSNGYVYAKSNTLIYGRGSDSDTLDPPLTFKSESMKVYSQIFDALVRYEKDSTEPQPSLATSWIVSKDQKKWMFTLRKNVFFHDGTLFNSSAVKYSFERIIDEKHPAHRNDFPYAAFFEVIQEIHTPDAHHVQFILKKPYAPFLQNLQLPAASIVSPAAVRKWGKDFGQHPVGTGPFIFDSWVKNEVIVLKANKHYWGEGPRLDRLIFKTIENNSERLLALKAESIHIMDSFSFSVINEFNKHPDLKLHEERGLNVGFLALNTSRKPLDNVFVRRAINMAINKKRLIQLFCQNVAVPAVTPMPPGEWSHNDNLIDYEYNQSQARELLTEAGFVDGLSLTLLMSPLSRSYIPYPKKFGQFIKANLGGIGIKVELLDYTTEKFWEYIVKGEYDIASMGWTGDNGDPDNFFYSLFHSHNATAPTLMNYARYKNDMLDSLLIEAQSTLDFSKRKELYFEIQRIILEEAPWVPLAHGKVLIAARTNVRNIELLPILPNIRLNTVFLSNN